MKGGEEAMRGSLRVRLEDYSTTRRTPATRQEGGTLSEMFWGDRYCVVEDPFRHSWSIATHTRDVSDNEIQEAAKKGAMVSLLKENGDGLGN